MSKSLGQGRQKSRSAVPSGVYYGDGDGAFILKYNAAVIKRLVNNL